MLLFPLGEEQWEQLKQRDENAEGCQYGKRDNGLRFKNPKKGPSKNHQDNQEDKDPSHPQWERMLRFWLL